MFRLFLLIYTLLFHTIFVNGSHYDSVNKVAFNNEMSSLETSNLSGSETLSLLQDGSGTFSNEIVPELEQSSIQHYSSEMAQKRDIARMTTHGYGEKDKLISMINESKKSEYFGSDPIERSKNIQKPFSIKKILSEYSKGEIALMNEFHLAITLLLRRGLKKYFFRKYKPSYIRSTFAKKYAQLFGGSSSSALLKLIDFERKLSIKHSAAKKLFSSQMKTLEYALNSYKANIHLVEKWRNQPTYVSEPILVVNKNSYNKVRTLCRKRKNIDIILITASPENIPKKFEKPEVNESYLTIPKLQNLIQSIQNSLNDDNNEISASFGSTECKWRHSRKKSKRRISKLFCFHKKKSRTFHIHFYDVKNVTIFSHLIKSILKYRPNVGKLGAKPLFLVPALVGIPEINQKGTIIGLNSINVKLAKKIKRGHRKRR